MGEPGTGGTGPDDTGTQPTGMADAGTVRVNTMDEAREAVRAAHDARTPVRIVGAGTWLHGGRPVVARQRLDLAGLAGITEYVPGDLTLTAGAGTSLGEIEEAAARHGQWLPLDPFGMPGGTLGATLATASCGPLGGALGLPRDLTVGVAFVTGDGQLVRGGGRVVKNVAGFDLVRMSIGAWGTLGVIVEATVRLRARPAVDVSLALPVPDDAGRLIAWLLDLRAAPMEPLCAELLSAALAARLALGEAPMLLVRLAGNATAVRHQREALARLGSVTEVPDETWSRLRVSDRPATTIVRVSRRPSELGRLWTVATRTGGVDAHASVSRGIVRLRLDGNAAAVQDVLSGFDPGDARIVEQGDGGPVPADANEALATRLRLAFDPRGILNPGILGGASA